MSTIATTHAPSLFRRMAALPKSGRSINICGHALRWTGARGRREFDPSLQRYFRRKTRARRLEAAGLCLALSVRLS
jgi:hypothetical protein